MECMERKASREIKYCATVETASRTLIFASQVLPVITIGVTLSIPYTSTLIKFKKENIMNFT